GTEKANAQFELAQQNYDRQAELFQKRVIAQATLDTYTRNLETTRQSLTGAKAEEERARLAYSSNIEGVNTTVARLTSELADAQWDLDQTVTRASAAGFVTQVGLRPGMYVVPAAFPSVMVFVNTDPRDQEFSAAFQQNSLQRVMAGDEAEAAFDAVPGRVFKGKVRYVLDAIAAGQLQPTGGSWTSVRGLPAAGRSPSTTSRMPCRPRKSRPARQPRSRSIPSTGTTSRCCARSSCACAAGRITSSWRAIRSLKRFAKRRAHLPAPPSRSSRVTRRSSPPTFSSMPSARNRSRTRPRTPRRRSAMPRRARSRCSWCNMRAPARSIWGDAERSQTTRRMSRAAS